MPLNVLNPQDIEPFIRQHVHIGKERKDRIALWFSTVLKNYVLRNPQFHEPVSNFLLKTSLWFKTDAPQWVKEALKNNAEIHRFTASADLEFWHDIIGVNDWWHHLDPSTDTHLKNWRRVSVPQALELSKQWHEQLARKKRERQSEDWQGVIPIVDLSDDYQAVQLKSASALEREGALLGHCVAGYWNRVQRDQCNIYSIRDKNNTPHVTIEIVKNQITQLSGTANSRPVKYAKLIKEFVRHAKIDIGRYGESLGIFQIGYNCFESLDEACDKLSDLWHGVQKNGYVCNSTWFHSLIRFINFHKVNLNDRHKTELVLPLMVASHPMTFIEPVAGTRLKRLSIKLPDAICTFHIMFNGLFPLVDEQLKIILKQVIQDIKDHPDTIYDLTRIVHQSPSQPHMPPGVAGQYIINTDGLGVTFLPGGGGGALQIQMGGGGGNGGTTYSTFSSSIVQTPDTMMRILIELELDHEFNMARWEAAAHQFTELKNASSDIMRKLNGNDRHKLSNSERERLLHTLRVSLPLVQKDIINVLESAKHG